MQADQRRVDSRCIRVAEADRQHLRLPWMPLVRAKLTEWAVKLLGKRIVGQGLIGADAGEVAQGFGSLSSEQFARYNFPQVWVERRAIPVAIDGKLPITGAVVLDLGCGPGTSTEVLCHFADPTWSITGFDLTETYIDQARWRAERAEYKNRRGQTIAPRFVCQDISQPLMDPSGSPLPANSAHLAISGGVVGLYMNRASVERLARELYRVIRPGGYAALDCGPAVPKKVLRQVLENAGFAYAHSARSVVIDPRPKLIFRKPGR